MTKFRLYFCDALIDFAFFIFVCVAASLPVYIFAGDAIEVPLLFALIIPHSFLFFLRMKRRNFFLFGFCHLLLYFIPFNITDNPSVIAVFFIVVTALIIYSYVVYFSNSKRAVSALSICGACAVFTSLYIFSGYSGYVFIQNIILAGSICILLCFFLSTHLSNVDKMLLIITSSTIQPVDKIIKSCNKIIFVFLVLTGILLLLSRYFFIGDLLNLLGLALLSLIRLLIRRKAPEAPEPVLEPESLPTNDNGSDGLVFSSETSLFWVILEKITWYVVFVALICLVIFIVLSVVRNFYKRFNGHNDGEDIKEFVVPEIFMARPLIKMIRENFAPANKIRRVFYKKVKVYIASKKIEVKKDDTAYEISQKINEYEDINSILKIYEEVRYGKGREK